MRALALAHLLAPMIGEILVSPSPAFAQTPLAGPPPAPEPSATPPPLTPPTSREVSPTGCRGCIHHGFYFGASTGFGTLGIWGNGPSGSASLAGFATGARLAIGGSPIPGLAVAGVAEGASITGVKFTGGPAVMVTVAPHTQPPNIPGNARASMFLLGALADWFPVPTGGWHVGLALGLGGDTVTDDAGRTMNGASVTGSVFGGYQWWLGSNWSLGISGIVSIAPPLTMRDPDGNDVGYQMMPLSGGVQFLLLYY